VPDSNGGAYVFVECVDIGPKYAPSTTWMAGHLVPTVPYGDVYPLFIGGDVKRVDGQPFVAPISPVSFQGRAGAADIAALEPPRPAAPKRGKEISKGDPLVKG